MKQEAGLNQPLKDLKKLQEYAALAAGVSLRSGQNVVKEMKASEDDEQGSPLTTDKKRRMTATKTVGMVRLVMAPLHCTDNLCCLI